MGMCTENDLFRVFVKVNGKSDLFSFVMEGCKQLERLKDL